MFADTTFSRGFGNEYVSNKIQVDYTHCFPAKSERDVLVGRFFAGLRIDDAQSNQQFIVGQGPDIRIYTQGKYRGDYLLALQGEYRWTSLRNGASLASQELPQSLSRSIPRTTASCFRISEQGPVARSSPTTT